MSSGILEGSRSESDAMWQNNSDSVGRSVALQNQFTRNIKIWSELNTGWLGSSKYQKEEFLVKQSKSFEANSPVFRSAQFAEVFLKLMVESSSSRGGDNHGAMSRIMNIHKLCDIKWSWSLLPVHADIHVSGECKLWISFSSFCHRTRIVRNVDFGNHQLPPELMKKPKWPQLFWNTEGERFLSLPLDSAFNFVNICYIDLLENMSVGFALLSHQNSVCNLDVTCGK